MIRGLRERAPAKLNLALHIHGRRADGYHLLESLVCFLSLGDTVSAEQADNWDFECTGEFAEAAGEGESNLVWKAARALQAHANIPHAAHLRLEKTIPVGAGLGGGSADAAATLRVLNRLWGLNLSHETLLAIARPLGADVAMCLASTPLYAGGIGDELHPLSSTLPSFWLVLAHPRTPLLTAEVYRALHAAPTALTPPAPAVHLPETYPALLTFLHAQRNDLQPPAVQCAPIVSTLLAALSASGADLVRMTGSGACCFGIYETQARAETAAEQLRKHAPEWWVETAQCGA